MDKASIIKALRDTAQSASNTISENVSAPVDMISAALRYGGLPIPQNPAGGAKWMAEKGLTREVEAGIPKTVGETLGLVTPILGLDKTPKIASIKHNGQTLGTVEVR